MPKSSLWLATGFGLGFFVVAFLLNLSSPVNSLISSFFNGLIFFIFGFVLVSLIVSIRRGGIIIKTGALGTLSGFLLWFYDYDFLLNVGGPSTPISDSIREMVGINNTVSPSSIFIPPVILILSGGVIGVLVGWIINAFKNRGV